MTDKIIWKFKITNADEIDTHQFFKLFNDWIEPDSPEIFVDVADYRHVEDGPKVILVGHYVDYILDHTERELGFVYSRKRECPGSNLEEKLQSSLEEFLRACQKLISNETVQLDTRSIQLTLNDRALAPNNSETFTKVQEALKNVLEKKFGEVSLEHQSNPKERFSIKAQANSAKSIGELCL